MRNVGSGLPESHLIANRLVMEANTMSMYKYIRQLWKQPSKNLGELWRERLIAWRQEPSTVRIERPTRIDKARSLGYKAKQGYLIVRQRIMRSKRQRPKIRSGRRSKHFGRRKDISMSHQTIAERRVARKYVNLEVLNSYFVAKDGKFKWYEVILVDKAHPAILADHRINWIADSQHRRRVFRGLTSSAKHSRGLHQKGLGVIKARPSLRAHNRTLR